MAAPQADTVTTAEGSVRLGTPPTYAAAPAPPPPSVPNFTASPLTGGAPLTVQFTDISTGVIDSRLWSFGDGYFDTGVNPSHSYAAAGTYSPSLTTTNASGPNTQTRTGYITALVPPVADFTGTPTTGAVYASRSFSDASTGSISTWAWTFGDGGTSSSQSPNHTYTTAGSYTVTLTVTGPGGTSTKTRTNYMSATAADTLTLSGPTTGSNGTPDTFTVTPNGVLESTLVCTLGATNSGTLSVPTLTFTAGTSAAQTFTVTRSTDGTSSVSISSSLTEAGSPISYATTTAVPTWASGLAVNGWTQINATNLSSVEPSPLPLGQGGGANKIDAWCGAASNQATGDYIIGEVGGHADYSGNEIDALCLRDDAPAWREVVARTADANLYNRTAFNADYHGASAHTYNYLQFLPSLGTAGVFVSFNNSGTNYGPQPAGLPVNPPTGWPYVSTDPATWVGDAYDFRWSPALDWNSATFLSPTYIPEFPTVSGDWTAALCMRHPTTDDVYIARLNDRWRKLTAATRTWSDVSGNYETNYCAGAIDPVRNRALIVGGYGGAPAPRVRDLSGTDLGVTFGGLGGSVLTGVEFQHPGVIFDETNDRFLVFKNGTTISVYAVDASTFAVSLLTTTGSAPAQRTNGLHNSPQWFPDIGGGVGGVALANTYTGNVYFLRTH